MKPKQPLLFEDYTLPPPDAQVKSDCIHAVRRCARTPVRRLGLINQLSIQLHYLGLTFWVSLISILCVFVGIFLYLTLYMARYSFTDAQHDTSVLLTFVGPALSLLMVPVLNKSFVHGMWELEESSLHSLPRLTTLRILLALFISLPVLAVAACLGLGFIGLWQTLYCLILPLLLSCLANFILLGYLRGLAGSIICFATDLLLAFFVVLLTTMSNKLLPLSPPVLLICIAFALLGCIFAALRLLHKPVSEGSLQ